MTCRGGWQRRVEERDPAGKFDYIRDLKSQLRARLVEVERTLGEFDDLVAERDALRSTLAALGDSGDRSGLPRPRSPLVRAVAGVASRCWGWSRRARGCGVGDREAAGHLVEPGACLVAQAGRRRSGGDGRRERVDGADARHVVAPSDAHARRQAAKRKAARTAPSETGPTDKSSGGESDWAPGWRGRRRRRSRGGSIGRWAIRTRRRGRRVVVWLVLPPRSRDAGGGDCVARELAYTIPRWASGGSQTSNRSLAVCLRLATATRTGRTRRVAHRVDPVRSRDVVFHACSQLVETNQNNHRHASRLPRPRAKCPHVNALLIRRSEVRILPGALLISLQITIVA